MAKLKEVFVCQNCGAASPKWQGQCAVCGEWNTLVSEAAPSGARHRGSSAARSVRAGTNVVELQFGSLIAPAGASIIRYHDARDDNLHDHIHVGHLLRHRDP